MTALIKKIHMYAGLFSFTALAIYGLAGLDATFAPPPGAPETTPPQVEMRDYTPPPGAGDKQVADHVHALLNPPLAGPLPAWAVRRNASNDLQLDFYSPNGITRAIVLEKENRLRVERIPFHFGQFLNNLHGMTLGDYQKDYRLRLWSWYNEIALWSLALMVLSGLWLWLASRPSWKPAQLTFAAAAGLFLVLYTLTR
jgi:uncharacterized iron-regulated membrane protein